jgi:undecaprenyl-diphosphatase
LTERPPGGLGGAHDAPEAIPIRRAIALGLIQGPGELLPVSSSAHLILVPWLAGWRWERLDPELRKSFEVALHAGAAAALLAGQRRLIAEELRAFDARRASVLVLSFAPAAVIGYAFERPIERRLGSPRATAAGLLAGAVALVASDRRPQARGRGEAQAADGLALGVAQAAALAPGVSRNGATLAVARWRRFSRDQANLLSRTVALPPIAGAALLKGVRLRRRDVDSGLRRVIAVGIAASFASTLASQRLISLVERDRALWPYAAYRAALAGLVFAKLLRDARNARRRAARIPWPTGERAPEISGDGTGLGDSAPSPAPAAAKARPDGGGNAGTGEGQAR